jgi:hypothetical protein
VFRYAVEKGQKWAVANGQRHVVRWAHEVQGVVTCDQGFSWTLEHMAAPARACVEYMRAHSLCKCKAQGGCVLQQLARREFCDVDWKALPTSLQGVIPTAPYPKGRWTFMT